MSRVVVIVMAAWSAMATRIAASDSLHASVRSAKIVSDPNGPPSPISGAAITEWMPVRRTKASPADPCGNESSSR